MTDITDADVTTLHPADEWYEDHGPVLWHHIGEWGDICEAPIVSCGGTELHGHQPWNDYYSHWSKLPNMPRWPLRSLKLAPSGMLLCDVEVIDHD